MDKTYLTTEEAALYLTLGKSTVDSMCSRGELPFYKPSRRRVFKREELDDFLTRYRVATNKELAAKAEEQLTNIKTKNND